MSDPKGFSIERIQALQTKLSLAIDSVGTEVSNIVAEALGESHDLLASLLGAVTNGSARYDGFIDHTFVDEAYEPHGREVDVRIFYDWQDYDADDEPSPVWGADIADIAVRQVRYLDQDGNVQEMGRHHEDVAWDLLEQQRDFLTELCTDDGCHNDVGIAHPLHSPCPIPMAASEPDGRRMAPSARNRVSIESQQKLG